jgi:hypothetical protein
MPHWMEFQPFFPSCCRCGSFFAPQNFHPPSLPATLLPQCLSVCTMYGGLSESPSHSKKRSRFRRQTSSSIVLSGALHPPPAPTAAGWGTPVHFSKVGDLSLHHPGSLERLANGFPGAVRVADKPTHLIITWPLVRIFQG